MSSGVALAILASVVVVTFAVLAVIRMRRTFDEPVPQARLSEPAAIPPTNGKPSPQRSEARAPAPAKPVQPGKPGPIVQASTRGGRSAESRPAPGPQPLAVEQPPKKPTKKAAKSAPAATQGKAYVAALEDEDDVPTTLYRKDDDPDVEALLAEFDTEDGKR